MIGANRGYQVKLVPAGQRLARAQAHPEGLRRGDGVQRRRRKAPTAPSACAARSTWPIRTATSTPTSTTIRPTGRRTSRHTGPEIIEQTGGRLTHFVAAMGTSGTFTGVTRRLQRDLPDVKCYLGAAFQRLPRPGRPEAHAHRHRAGHLRRQAGRRQRLDGNRGRLPHGAAPGARRRAAGGHFLGRQRARRYRAGARAGGARRKRRSS